MSELQERMDSKEFAQWMAFARIEPYGDLRDDARAALVAATVANVHTPKGRKAADISDFMLRFKQKERPQSLEQLKAQWKAATSGMRRKH